MARREKQPVHKVVMTEGKRNIVHQLLEEYDIQTAEDIQEALKDLLGSTLKEMMEAEMDEHLGYEKNSVLGNNSGNSRNGYGKKTIISDYGECEISVPRDRNGECEPKVIEKRQTRTDLSRISILLSSLTA